MNWRPSMYQSFLEYKQLRENNDLNHKVNLLCESIVKSEKTFDEWWIQHGMPTILENAYSNENELLMELMGGVGNFLGNVTGRATQGLQNLGRGIANGWQQGRQAVAPWSPYGGMNPNAGGQGDPNVSTSQNQQSSQFNPNEVLQIHQQLMQKLKDLQNSNVQNKDQQSYAAVQNLMQQMNALPNVIRNLPQPNVSPGQQNQQRVANIDPAKQQSYRNRNSYSGGNVQPQQPQRQMV